MIHIITALKWQKSQPDRTMIFLDGKPWASVSLMAAGRLKVGDRIDAETAAQLQIDQQRRDAYQCALRFLGVRDRSALEIRQKLRLKGFDKAVSDQALRNLIEKKYVNDQLFAVNWVNYRMRNSPRSTRLLAQELKQKGINAADIASALVDVDEHDLALACLRRKRRRWQRFDGRERRQKMLAHLAQKGFAYDVSIVAVDAFRDQVD